MQVILRNNISYFSCYLRFSFDVHRVRFHRFSLLCGRDLQCDACAITSLMKRLKHIVRAHTHTKSIENRIGQLTNNTWKALFAPLLMLWGFARVFRNSGTSYFKVKRSFLESNLLNECPFIVLASAPRHIEHAQWTLDGI